VTVEEQIAVLSSMIGQLVSKGNQEFVARILVRLQLEYMELARLATDGEYEAGDWTHRDVMDFLTTGQRDNSEEN